MAYEVFSLNDVDFNTNPTPYGIRINGYFLSKPVYDVILQSQINLKDVLLTYPGERTGQWSTYGCRLRELVFEPNVNDSDLKSIIVDFIVDAVDAWIPNINLIDVAVTTAEDDPNLKYNVEIKITYNINGIATSNLTLNVSDTGTITT
jgi:phage baseplate assembly protein W